MQLIVNDPRLAVGTGFAVPIRGLPIASQMTLTLIPMGQS